MARTIFALSAPSPKPTRQFEPGFTPEATATIVETLIAKSLAKDDLLGRLCGSLDVAKIRRGGKR